MDIPHVKTKASVLRPGTGRAPCHTFEMASGHPAYKLAHDLAIRDARASLADLAFLRPEGSAPMHL